VLFVRWAPIANPTPVDVDVHISDTSGFTPDATTLHSTVNGTQVSIRSLPDGTPLEYVTTVETEEGGTTAPKEYYIVLQAHNDAGTAPPSAEASGHMVQINSGDIAAAYVYAGNIVADQIQGGRLDSEVIVGGDIYAEGAAGERVSLSGSGFSVTGPIPPGEAQGPIYVNFPTDGAKPNIFSGTVEARTLEVVEGATLRGAANQVASQGTLQISSGVQAPQSQPATEISRPTVEIDTSTTRVGADNLLGRFALDPAACYGLTWDGTHWYTAQIRSDWFGEGTRIWQISATGATSAWTEIMGAVYGLAHVGGNLYGVVDGTSIGTGWTLARITSTGNVVGETYNRINDNRHPTLGTDGALLLVGEREQGTNALFIRSYSPSNLGAITTTRTTASGTLTGDAHPGGVAMGTFDFGDSVIRIVTTWRGGPNGDYMVCDASGNRRTQDDWPRAAYNLRSFCWDGTQFCGLNASAGVITKYTGLKWTTESSKWWVGYSWADTDTTSSRTATVNTGASSSIITAAAGTFSLADVGGVITGTNIPAGTTILSVESSASATLSQNATGAGTITATIYSAAHETPLGPKVSLTMEKRARLTITTTGVPAGSGPDDPNAANIYLGRGSTEPARTSMFRQSSGPTTLTTSAPTFSGTNPPATNNFPSTAPGKIAAGNGGFSVDGNSNGSVGTGSFRDSIFPAWTTYTPTFTASSTNPTLGNFTRTGRYAKVGRTVHFVIVITCNATSGFGSGNYRFGLPVTARSAEEFVATANQSSPNHNYIGRSDNGTEVFLYLTTTDGIASNTSTGMSNGTVLRITGTYEAAA
jgi:hypothetical protein